MERVFSNERPKEIFPTATLRPFLVVSEGGGGGEQEGRGEDVEGDLSHL